MRYPVAERFKAPQGEGLHTGTQMAFVRLVGCSVGQKVCTACDTEFDRVRRELGGGSYDEDELVAWAGTCRHLCLTGGEPLDRDVREILMSADNAGKKVHVETSGTRRPEWLGGKASTDGVHVIQKPGGGPFHASMWLTVSPKPGYLEEMLALADELKVILGGLGDGPGWPTLEDALRWADMGKLVYVQPRNLVNIVAPDAMESALETVARYPQLRLSCQLHKYLRTR